MVEVSELDAIKAIDEALSGVSDPSTRLRILKWAWEKFSPTPQAVPIDSGKEVSKKVGTSRKKTSKPKPALSIVKDLNLKPTGKKSFADFVNEKSPSSIPEKCVACTYYIINELKGSVSVNHVFTCFKHIGWRLPPDLAGVLYWTASQKGWLDTADTSDIKVAVGGYNLIEHDLPRKKKATK
ncbi:MAG: hypothetical protein NTW48_04880 [Chloroflexi bacterium]|nr:hypothetical protein [Chloroflexota bacterium]